MKIEVIAAAILAAQAVSGTVLKRHEGQHKPSPSRQPTVSSAQPANSSPAAPSADSNVVHVTIMSTVTIDPPSSSEVPPASAPSFGPVPVVPTSSNPSAPIFSYSGPDMVPTAGPASTSEINKPSSAPPPPPPGRPSAAPTWPKSQGAQSTAVTSSPKGGFLWPSAPVSSSKPVNASAEPSKPSSAPAVPPIPVPRKPTTTPSPSSQPPLPEFTTLSENPFAFLTSYSSAPPGSPATPEASTTEMASSKTPGVVVPTSVGKRDVEEGDYTILPHIEPADKRSNVFSEPRIPGAGDRNGFNPALDNEKDTPYLERRTGFKVVVRPVTQSSSNTKPPNSIFTPKPTPKPNRPTSQPTASPKPSGPKPSPSPSNTSKPSPAPTPEPTNSTKSAGGNEDVKTIVVSEDPRCPYPYPGIHCGKPTTTLTTETKKASETGKDKPEKTGWCAYPYPGGHGEMC